LQSLVSSVVNPDVPINDALYPGSPGEEEESTCPQENPDNPYEIPTPEEDADNVHFGYPAFDEDFIDVLLKKETPEAIRYVKKEFDWDKVEGSKTYCERVLRRARRER
jgi:hypothetical protein